MTSILKIAEMAYEVNRAYRRKIGQTPPKPWSDLNLNEREQYCNGVEFLLAYPNAPLNAQHDNWLHAKRALGWVYGKTLDPEKKTHPNMVPYDQLPEEEREKDRLFRRVVEALHLLA